METQFQGLERKRDIYTWALYEQDPLRGILAIVQNPGDPGIHDIAA